MKIRGGTRVVNSMLTKLGATPVGMPVPAVTEALSKGVLDGTTIPWEVAPALKVQELVKNHTTFAGDRALYVTTFVVAMNKNSYNKLPADLKKIIDDNSGVEFSAMIARTQDVGDNVGRDLALKAGNKITTLDIAETQRWRARRPRSKASGSRKCRAKGWTVPAGFRSPALIDKHNK
jgi:TRAP-type transport system periplasmic protein